MNVLIAEFIGTAILILLGGGVVANVVLKDTKGNNSGWIVISTAWALAVFAGVTIAGPSQRSTSKSRSHSCQSSFK
ncbi:aquaporin [Sphingobacterium sp. SG20118]|uniref:aquaporin n=1 Tax=Sphingobacterium sp. SG20118 TaxID=3367156 RepID=UPI0037DFC98C